MKHSLTALTLLALTACTTPDGNLRIGGLEVNVEAAERVGKDAMDRAFETTSFTAAIDTLARYCRFQNINVASVKKKLTQDGYLFIGRKRRERVEVFAHPDARPVVGLSATGDGRSLCLVMMAKGQNDPNKIEQRLRKKMFKNIERVAFDIPQTDGVWVVNGNRDNLLILVDDRESPVITYITGS